MSYQSHRGLRGQKRSILGLGGEIHVFRSDFRQEHEIEPRSFLNDPNRTKFENKTMPKNVHSGNNGLF